MIQFSIPAALSIFAATSAVAVTSVAVAVPALQPAESIAATSTASPTPTATNSAPAPNGDGSPFSGLSNHDLGNGVLLQDVATGLTANIRPTGVTFVYKGPCTGSGDGAGASMTIWGNNGQKKSWGSAGYCNNGQTFGSTGMVWSEDTRNSYCYSPLGGASAYRAEVFGQFSEWVPIPAEYMQCVNGQAPEGPTAPSVVPPVTDPAPAPAPSASSSTDVPTEAPSPSSTP
ncbi:hypothetical protein [Aurantimicrobium minutum]|uniref:hypothetical protein n=1 Tax=Aurantimicrobium minutum TaxID=708131 RepID=UPI002475E27C|nr:hypothetical protein [Aurantimicrobium minutum]MDH6536915.1 hypothetical protein [Aurantimicrobium minutum]